jgi:uncharacterized protein YbjQ (UPF0145 family)
MENEIIVTTTNSLEGYKIIKYLSPIVSNIVIGSNILSDYIASWTDYFGGRSRTYQNKLAKMYNIAIDELKKEAQEKGANCILGIKIDFDEISGIGKQMFMLNAMGTAVIIKDEKEIIRLV